MNFSSSVVVSMSNFHTSFPFQRQLFQPVRDKFAFAFTDIQLRNQTLRIISPCHALLHGFLLLPSKNTLATSDAAVRRNDFDATIQHNQQVN